MASRDVAQHEKSRKNEKPAAQRQATLRTYADPVIGKLFVRDVTPAHVIKVLKPIWATKTETASRVRSRVELVLDFAAARGLREGPSPARWRGNLDAAFLKASRVAKVQRHTAVAVADIGDFVNRLRQQQGVAAKALGFAILVAALSTLNRLAPAPKTDTHASRAMFGAPWGRKGAFENPVLFVASDMKPGGL